MRFVPVPGDEGPAHLYDTDYQMEIFRFYSMRAMSSEGDEKISIIEPFWLMRSCENGCRLEMENCQGWG